MSYDDDDDISCEQCGELHGRSHVPCRWGDCPYDHDPECDEEEEDWP